VINPFTITKPATLGQWLWRSVAWAAACVGGWVAFYWLLAFLFSDASSADGSANFNKVLLFIGFLFAHGLIWQRAVTDYSPIGGFEKLSGSVWLTIVSGLWVWTLTLFQVVCAVAAALWLLFAFDSSEHVMWYT
jgi:hypothetical protein